MKASSVVAERYCRLRYWPDHDTLLASSAVCVRTFDLGLDGYKKGPAWDSSTWFILTV